MKQAAPALLAACEKLLLTFGDPSRAENAPPSFDDLVESLGLAREAIAKAKGQA